MIQLTNGENTTYQNPLPDYNPQKDHQDYKDKLTALPRTREDYDKLAAIRDAKLAIIRNEAIDYHPDPAHLPKRTDKLIEVYLKLPVRDKERKVKEFEEAAKAAKECWDEIQNNASAGQSKQSAQTINLNPDSSRTRVPDNARKK